ncbi:WD-40 repeat-containing MSI4 [Micractinium conductrix]|uniref:WD-40 repeat-containing MSI4 n=1 Tax=Micractinium conductrix TaxID=554055 RepID=A0A2P6VC16_9CHLO|nr:WD-40 repeat-containing MSI4 [Micractinium conductrix]|eukprot:PSC71637.1 WD-40 repeat-containing MSI4 [Micractinium conductrix]
MAANVPAPGEEANHQAWKRMVPYLYDWFASHALPWPSLACRWGPVVEEGGARSRQRLYLTEQTDGSEPNRLVVVNVDVARPRTATADHLQGFTEHSKSLHVGRPLKTILHPGEVNRLRELPQHPHVVVTHTDSPLLFVWNLITQADRTGVKSTSAKQQSTADLVLEGHEADAEFALGASGAAPRVASGGKDTKVLVWDLEGHGTSLAAPASGGSGAAGVGTRLQPLQKLEGHSETVEDVCWRPGSTTEIASVGDDFSLLLWDLRKGGPPAQNVQRAHGKNDIHCVDWGPQQDHLLVTGAADGTVRVWDRRSTGSPAWAFTYHSHAVTGVEWSPHRKGVFASAGEDRLLCVWDLEAKTPVEADGPAATKRPRSATPHQLMFQHAGHRSPVVDFQWNPADSMALFSVSDEAGAGGGGTLQMYRISDLVYRPEDEVVAELEQWREYILTGQEAALARKPSAATLTAATTYPSGGGGGDADTDAAGTGAVGAA